MSLQVWETSSGSFKRLTLFLFCYWLCTSQAISVQRRRGLQGTITEQHAHCIGLLSGERDHRGWSRLKPAHMLLLEYKPFYFKAKQDLQGKRLDILIFIDIIRKTKHPDFPYPISKGEPSHHMGETHLGRLYPRSNSCGHYPKLMTTGEGFNVDWPVNLKFPLHHNGPVQGPDCC